MFQVPQQKRYKLATWMLVPFGLCASAFFFFNHQATPSLEHTLLSDNRLESRKAIAKVISENVTQSKFPSEISFNSEDPEKVNKYKINYTLQADLQEHADSLLKRYKPDYAAIVMMNAKTGEILAMTSFEKGNPDGTNLALRATYPAASIFKVITASTAVDKAGVSPEHRIAFNGGNYTLYKKNVLSDRINRWTRFITLKDAFARSINTAFGRLSLESIEPQDLSDYARKFNFNQEIDSDFNVEMSSATVPAEKGFALTQVASGYNRFNTLSPVHGSMIASTIINDGQMPSPYIVKNIANENNEIIYSGQTMIKGQVISAKSAEKVKQMMEQTVLAGTSRKTFKYIVRDRKFREVEMGGKTGHFSGTMPKGRNDWFVGYASDGDSKIAIAAITVNVKQWTVKSSALGEMMFRKYFKDKIEERETSLTDNADHDIEKVEKPVIRKIAKSNKRKSS
ncbi:MAG: penicillin-binding transpeptidase domain-containing protein [Pseudobdellovibrio sp.]